MSADGLTEPPAKQFESQFESHYSEFSNSSFSTDVGIEFFDDLTSSQNHTASQYDFATEDESQSKLNNGPFSDDLRPKFVGSLMDELDGETNEPSTDNTLLDALKKALERLSIPELRYEVMPVVLDRYQDPEIITRRGIAQILGKLATRLKLEDSKFELVPAVQALCQDVDSSVRAVIAKEIATFALVLNFTHFKSNLLPHLIDLCRDEDSKVRMAALEAVLNTIEHMDEKTCGRLIVPLVQGFFEDAYGRMDLSLVAVAQHIGRLCHSMKDVLSPSDRRWFLEFYSKLTKLEHSTFPSNGIINGSQFRAQHSISDRCRRWCAFNLPAMLQTAMSLETFNCRLWLSPIIKVLAQDPSPASRLHLAAGFHEICDNLDEEIAAVPEAFVDLLQTENIDILKACFEHLNLCLSYILTQTTMDNSGKDCNGNQLSGSQRVNKYTGLLVEKLIACNAVMKETTNWRPHELYLRQLAHLTKYLSSDMLNHEIVPMVHAEILTARPMPCRHAAIDTLLRFLLHTKTRSQRMAIIDHLISDLCFNQSCHKRQLYLDLCTIATKVFSRSFVMNHFLLPALRLSTDKVCNVRIKLCKQLPKLRALLSLPQDQERLNHLETVVRNLLKEEKNRNVLETLQAVIVELDYPSRHSISDIEDAERLEEECLLFSREDSEKQRARVSPMRCGIPTAASAPSLTTNRTLGKKPTNMVHPLYPQSPRFIPVSTSGTSGSFSTASTHAGTVTISTNQNSDNVSSTIYAPNAQRSRTRVAIVRPQRINRRPPSPRPPPPADNKEVPKPPPRFHGLQKSRSNSGIPYLKSSTTSTAPSSGVSSSNGHHMPHSNTISRITISSSRPPTSKAKSAENLNRVNNNNSSNNPVGGMNNNGKPPQITHTIPVRMSSSANGKLPPVPPRARRAISNDRFGEVQASNGGGSSKSAPSHFQKGVSGTNASSHAPHVNSTSLSSSSVSSVNGGDKAIASNGGGGIYSTSASHIANSAYSAIGGHYSSQTMPPPSSRRSSSSYSKTFSAPLSSLTENRTMTNHNNNNNSHNNNNNNNNGSNGSNSGGGSSGAPPKILFGNITKSLTRKSTGGSYSDSNNNRFSTSDAHKAGSLRIYSMNSDRLIASKRPSLPTGIPRVTATTTNSMLVKS